MASWEMVVCDGVLSRLLTQLTTKPTVWDEDWDGSAAIVPNTTRVIRDIENARLASPLWRDIIDESPEWALIRHSRYDFENEVQPVWESYDSYVVNRFFLSWETFNESWTLATSISCPRVRMDPLGWLTDLELSILRSHLWDPANIRIDVEDGSTIRHARNIWVSHRHRC
ncbi:hypothetical protein KC19_VG046400 [Ceratodon purpureus]|uniref:Uncharacterized protein n=1 Tax=Ceratodon purpureus TaxID=3225 RepID=A0A8T0HLY2_CERPU|nr:hypothetical protein KC19_VG046400 [Ceratodon purpureus]